MGIVTLDGFDAYADVDELRGNGWRYASPGGEVAMLSPNGGLFGQKCLEFTGNTMSSWKVSAVGPEYGTMFYSMYVRTGFDVTFRTTENYRYVYIRYDPTGLVRINVIYTAVVGLEIDKLATTVPWQMPVDEWVHLEVKIVRGDTATNGALEIRLNEVSIGAWTGLDITTSNDGHRPLEVVVSGKNGARVDDFIAMDTSGNGCNGFLPQHYIETLSSTGVGAYAQWAGANPYMSGTAGQRQSFVMSNLTAPCSAVYGVQERSRMDKINYGNTSVQGFLRLGGVDIVGTEVLGVSDFGVVQTRLTRSYINPITALAYTEANINSIETGVERV